MKMINAITFWIGFFIFVRAEGHTVIFPDEEMINLSKEEFSWLAESSTQKRGSDIVVEVEEEQLNELRQKFGKRMVQRKNPPCGNIKTNCNNKNNWPSFETISNWLKTISKEYSNFTRLFSVGNSVQNNPLWVLEISDKPGDQTEFEPNFKYIANMHGDEVVGLQMLRQLIELLLKNYSVSPRIKSLVDKTHIFIMPSMNPDGYISCTRGNSKNRDLNRDFPDIFTNNVNTDKDRQLETVAVMNWINSLHFTLSANIHGGEVVANYPWDGTNKKISSHTLDDDIFRNLALAYSRSNAPMFNNKEFPDGITNGAEWYILHGGMQDYNYAYAGCMELTLELSCEKWPTFSEIPLFWEDNINSLLNYMEQTHKGIRGIIRDAETNEPLENAAITIDDRPFKVYSDSKLGKYFRILLPGEYTVNAMKEGYETKSLNITVEEEKSLRVDIFLSKIPSPEPEIFLWGGIPASNLVKYPIISKSYILFTITAISTVGFAFWSWKRRQSTVNQNEIL